MKIKSIAKNQTELQLKDKTIFFSYNTPVACHISGKGYYKTNKQWSTTTTKHINQWLDGIQAKEKDQTWFNSLTK